MTIGQAHIEFKLTLDKVSSSSYPELLLEEIDYFLNEAISRFINQRYGKNNIYQKGFEEIQKRTEDLKGVVITNTLPRIVVANETRTYRYNLDALSPNYKFFIRARVNTNKPNCAVSLQSIKLVQQDDLERLRFDPFNKSRVDEPLAYFEDGDIFVIEDTTFVVGDMRITYIFKPTVVIYTNSSNQLCELSEHTHKEIIQLAVNIALENIESKRIQTQTEQVKTIE